jgi:hypothetical protein
VLRSFDSDITRGGRSHCPQLVKLFITVKKHAYRRHDDDHISGLDGAGKLLRNLIPKDLLDSRAAVGTRPLLIRGRGSRTSRPDREMPHACHDEQGLKR